MEFFDLNIIKPFVGSGRRCKLFVIPSGSPALVLTSAAGPQTTGALTALWDCFDSIYFSQPLSTDPDTSLCHSYHTINNHPGGHPLFTLSCYDPAPLVLFIKVMIKTIKRITVSIFYSSACVECNNNFSATQNISLSRASLVGR